MKNLKYFFLIITLTALTLVLITIYIITPKFKNVIIQNAKEESLRISEHLYSVVISEKEDKLKNSSEFSENLEKERQKFNIKKIKVYSTSAEVVYSSDLTDIGKINPNIPPLKKGTAYSELVEKGAKSIEGEKIATYVVETYIPIYKRDTFLGYFEIYYDVSDRLTSINNLTYFSLKIYTAILFIFLLVSITILVFTEKQRIKRPLINLDEKLSHSAIKNFIFVAVSIFIAELITMLIINALKIESHTLVSLYDSVLLSLIIAPILYLFLFRPLNESIDSLKEAKKKLIETNKILNEITNGISESILLIDSDLKVIWANKKATKEIGLSSFQIVGDYCYRLTHHLNQPCNDPLHPCPVDKVLNTGDNIIYEHVHYDKENNPIYVEVSVYPIKDDEGKITKFVHVSRNITEKKEYEKERERLISELQEKIENIKVLKGLIPICANCKKIRNDEGFWTHFETYIKEHSDVQFSHGICPECMKKLYPEYYTKINSEK